jgi:hypothetical protein
MCKLSGAKIASIGNNQTDIARSIPFLPMRIGSVLTENGSLTKRQLYIMEGPKDGEERTVPGMP